MIQKIIKIGNRAGIIIPKEIIEELGLKIGDTVRLTVDVKRKIIVIKSA